MARHFLSEDAAAVPYVAAAVGHSVGVDQLSIPARFRNADTVTVARYRREVTEAHDGRLRGFGFSKIGDYGVVGIAEVDPLKSAPIKIHLMQRDGTPVRWIMGVSIDGILRSHQPIWGSRGVHGIRGCRSHRHEFEVCVAQIDGVWDQLRREFFIGEPTIVLLRNPHP
jgi:hypothetical protein